MSRFSAGIAMLLVLGAAGIGGVAPAAAASVASCQQEKVLGPNGIWVDKIQVFHNEIAMELRQRGYNVDRVEPWSGCVKATVIDADGSLRMKFFDPDTLEELTTN
jgi:hypothetical protein